MLTNSAIAPTKEGHDKDDQLTAGINLCCAQMGRTRINTNSQALVGTGLAFEIPKGFYGQIKARSGFANRTGSLINAGVIDANYRGEVKVMISNPTNMLLDIYHGDGIAQMVILPVPKVELVEVDELTDTERGEQGFNSTNT